MRYFNFNLANPIWSAYVSQYNKRSPHPQAIPGMESLKILDWPEGEAGVKIQ
jgi:hypothetical protein